MDRKNETTRIPLELINNNNISFECRGFIMFLLTFEENEKIYFRDILEHFEMEKSAIIRIVDEAIEHGYMKMIQKTISGGSKESEIDKNYLVSETPIFLNDSKDTDDHFVDVSNMV